MVEVTGVDTQGGDSGGPWSLGNTAWGVRSGSLVSNDNPYFGKIRTLKLSWACASSGSSGSRSDRMMRCSVILALVGALALGSCSSDDDDDLRASGGVQTDDEGSLVVTVAPLDGPNAGVHDAGLLDGRIEIGPECITFVGVSNEPVLLIWHEGSVRLSSDGSSLTFTSPIAGSEPMQVHDQDSVDLGGTPAPGSLESPGRSLEYTRRPHESCPRDAFVVTEIQRPPR